jgi:hypothetical protein
LTQLNFSLPETIRLAWVSDGVRNLREPVIRKVRKAWAEIEWRAVCSEVRRCALAQVSEQDMECLAAASKTSGLKTIPLRVEERSNPDDVASLLFHVAIGKKRDASEFKSAWIRRDHDAMGELLGYPPCCRRFYHRIFAEERLTDPMWAIAQGSESSRKEADSIVLSGPPLLNLLLRSLGLRAIPHFPCSMECPGSVALANHLMDTGRSLGFSDEVNWLQEMLAWPVEWTALHGIAEIRTPIVKICTRTDATAGKRTIRWVGVGYPPDGVRGAAFPFKHPHE